MQRHVEGALPLSSGDILVWSDSSGFWLPGLEKFRRYSAKEQFIHCKQMLIFFSVLFEVVTRKYIHINSVIGKYLFAHGLAPCLILTCQHLQKCTVARNYNSSHKKKKILRCLSELDLYHLLAVIDSNREMWLRNCSRTSNTGCGSNSSLYAEWGGMRQKALPSHNRKSG